MSRQEKFKPALRSALIVDPETEFLDSLRKDSDFPQFEPALAASASEVHEALHGSGAADRYCGVFLDSRVFRPSWVVPLIKEVHQTHPATPIHILYGKTPPFSRCETQRLGVYQQIRKPLGLVELMRLGGIRPRMHRPGNLWLIGSPTTPPPPPKEDSRRQDSDQFIGVSAEELLSGLPALFDFYLKTPQDKFVKIVNAREVLEPEKIRTFLRHGGTGKIYFRKSVLERCLAHCEAIQHDLVRNSGISLELKFYQLMTQGNEVASLLEQLELRPNDPRIDQAFHFLAGAFSLVHQVAKNPAELIELCLSNAEALDHSVAVTLTCGLMTLALGLERPQTFRQLGIASLFHDVGLGSLPPKLRSPALDPRSLRADELALFQTHPAKGVETMQQLSFIEEVSLQAIAQHHERRDSLGFPGRAGPGEIHLFAELIGVSENWVRLSAQHSPALAIAAMEREVFPGYSLKVVDAFRAIFAPGGADIQKIAA